jgi:hypothetical protein
MMSPFHDAEEFPRTFTIDGKFIRVLDPRRQFARHLVNLYLSVLEVFEFKETRENVELLRKTVIGRRMQRLAKVVRFPEPFVGQFDAEEGGMMYTQLKALVRDLRRLREAKPVLFKRFKWKLVHDRDEGNFFGWRQELIIASDFINRNLPFDMPKSAPDFTVPYNGSNIYIECRSAHFNLNRGRASDAEVDDKIKRVIDEKLAKGYVGPSTALILDITNLNAHRSEKNKWWGSQEQAAQYISQFQAGRDKRYGAIFFHLWHFKSKTLQSGIQRYIDPDADPNLVQWIKETYNKRPISEQYVMIPLRT